jgi:hypothetical protein
MQQRRYEQQHRAGDGGNGAKTGERLVRAQVVASIARFIESTASQEWVGWSRRRLACMPASCLNSSNIAGKPMVRRRTSRYAVLAALVVLGAGPAAASEDAGAEPVEAAAGAALHLDAICLRLQALLAKDSDSPEGRKVAQTYRLLHCPARPGSVAAEAREPRPQQGAEAE